ncbi:unnamed protein product, partial [Iphiclides podalirius]
MARKSWNNHSQDWDPMRDDYNDTSYDAQYPDDDSGGGVQLDQCRLYITNIPKTLNEDGLRTLFSKYGTNVAAFLSKDAQKRFGLVTFESPGEAKLAMMKLNRTEPLNLNICIAHKKKTGRKQKESEERAPAYSCRDDSGSQCSRGRISRKQDDFQLSFNGDGELDQLKMDDDLTLASPDPHMNLEMIQLQMEQLKLKEAQLQCRQRMLLLNHVGKKQLQGGSNRCIMPDGRIIVRNVNRDTELQASENFGDGDMNVGRDRSRGGSWDRSGSGSGGRSSTSTSTCVHCEERREKSHTARRVAGTNTPPGESRAGVGSGRKGSEHEHESTLYEFKFSDLASTGDEEDEATERLILSRATDYRDEVEVLLKLAIAPDGYPKLKMRLRQMEMFQRAIDGIVDMQLKAGLLKRVPSFHDCYLNRGAIVCVCKDPETRDWVVRVLAGMEERMGCQLMLLSTKVKRICLAALRIPSESWPATARDVFKLLQYFNPSLRTDSWRIYAQKKSADGAECTSLLVDRVSGEIMRGHAFKNVIDYASMDFELTGHAEIYYEGVSSGLRDDLSSVASRARLLGELRSGTLTEDVSSTRLEHKEEEIPHAAEVKRALEDSLNMDAMKKLKGVEYRSGDNEPIAWSAASEAEVADDKHDKADTVSLTRDRADSVMDSLVDSAVTVDSRRGVAYHRRTNYLHVDNELKLAITLEDYPESKLDGTHIRRLKRLFKEQLNKDVKAGRLASPILPRFHDVFLSNGAVVYVCDSLESKDYLTGILPKFISSTGLKLAFKEVSQLLRYTRVVMRLPKALAHLESNKITAQLPMRYPGLKPERWKCYSDVAGKQKRQFGVDPESLDVIRSPGFEFSYEGETIEFRVIDRKKRAASFNETEPKSTVADENEALWERISREMFRPIGADLTSASLSRTRANHYTDLVADDLKLYIGPPNYPESRLDEAALYKLKGELKTIVLEALRSGHEAIPQFHDLYLFDGVVFAICGDFESKSWLEGQLETVGARLGSNLRSTEYRGAVGIVSMQARTALDTDEVIATLQSLNPRLRTRFWRTISVVRSQGRLDAVLQIDRLSAQVITDPRFERRIGGEPVQFKLGHLQSLVRPKTALAYIERRRPQPEASDKDDAKTISALDGEDTDYCRMTLKVPAGILPERRDDFNVILDLLEDKNPGLNTELWRFACEGAYPSGGRFNLLVDKQSASVIKGEGFDGSLGGEQLKFLF